MKEKKTVTQNLEYFKKICSTDFYKNDREFLAIIGKLTQHSASLSNTAVTLVSFLSDADRIKLEMIENEVRLGLSNENKPYGHIHPHLVKNIALVYKTRNQKLKEKVDKFIYLLENYMEEEELQIKKEMLCNAKNIIPLLEDLNINPLHLIINTKRAKVWYLLDSAYEKTLKTFDIDFFIQKIKNSGIKHSQALTQIKGHHKKRQDNIFKIIKARKEKVSKEEIDVLQAKISQELSTDIEPLLIDTKKIMDSLNFLLEELPDELNTEQSHELKEFLPAISEYYIDQSYAVSGGNSYTTLAKNLQFLQESIDNNEPADIIFQELKELGMTMQHLYILHWMAESLLKEIVHCYTHECSMGKTIRTYKFKNPNTNTSFSDIDGAVKFRNNIAHNGLIWNPEGIKKSIDAYRVYIILIAQESKLNLKTFKLPRMDRELTEEQKKTRIDSYISLNFQKTIAEFQELDDKLYNEFVQKLEKSKWTLHKDTLKIFSKKIRKGEQETFCQEHFKMGYKDVQKKFEEYAEKNFHDYDSQSSKAMALFTWTFSNKDKQEHQNGVKENIQKLKERILAVELESFQSKKIVGGGV